LDLGSGQPTDEELAEQRQAYLDAVIASPATRKLIVAGPGTGKTHSFKVLLESRPEPRLVLTFINNLVNDLGKALGDLAEVRTFHAYCRNLLHNQGAIGVTRYVRYYPGLTALQATDYSVLTGDRVTANDVEFVFNTLAEAHPILHQALVSGSYYNAVGHSDAVYRVLKYFQARPRLTPTYGQVLVDEFQDFNALEVAFIDLLADVNPILIVGDDDQALYERKQASPEFIRALAQSALYERFELPFCSRCPEVVVDAVDKIVAKAQTEGLLAQRVAKAFACYLPDKRSDSERYPKITHAECTVQNTKTRYMERYVERQIHDIPDVDNHESISKEYPTALVVGLGHFIGPIYEHLASSFPNVTLRKSADIELGPLDGYSMLLGDSRHRLGWRILCEYDVPVDLGHALRESFQGGELFDLLPPEYQERHLGVLALIERLLRGEELTAQERDELERATRVTEEVLREQLGASPSASEEPPETIEETEPSTPDTSEPSIVVTTLVGAKGLEAGHVFVAGLIGGHFPKDNAHPTETEVCQFMVALTRARKRVFVISARNYAGKWVDEGVFIDWLGQLAEKEVVDKDYPFGT
jgi:superfamily I DNA/RNA helicase